MPPHSAPGIPHPAFRTRYSAENRVSIVDAGGIEPLLSIIGHKENSKAKEASLAAISKLSYNSESIQLAITEAGGIPLLVNALASSSNAKEMMVRTFGGLERASRTSQPNQPADAISFALRTHPLSSMLSSG